MQFLLFSGGARRGQISASCAHVFPWPFWFKPSESCSCAPRFPLLRKLSRSMTSTSWPVVCWPVVGAPTEIQSVLLDTVHGHQIIFIQSEPNGRQRQYTCRLEKAVEFNSVDKFCGDIRRRSGQPEEEVGPASETIVPWTSEPQPPLPQPTAPRRQQPPAPPPPHAESAASSTQLNSLAPTLAVWRCGSAVPPVSPTTTTAAGGAASGPDQWLPATADGKAAKWLDSGLRGVTDRLWSGVSLSEDSQSMPFNIPFNIQLDNIQLDPMHVDQLGAAAQEVALSTFGDDGDDSALSRPTSKNKLCK